MYKLLVLIVILGGCVENNSMPVCTPPVIVTCGSSPTLGGRWDEVYYDAGEACLTCRDYCTLYGGNENREVREITCIKTDGTVTRVINVSPGNCG